MLPITTSMRNLIRPFTLPAAMLIALLVPSVRAQVETFDTIPSYNGQGIVGFTSGNTDLIQTVTNVLELNSVTFQITNTGADAVSQNINAYLVQWDTTNAVAETTLTAPTTVGGNDVTNTISTSPVASYTVPPVGTGGWAVDQFSGGGNYNAYNITLTLNRLLDPSLTYAVVLIDTTNASGLGLLDTGGSGGLSAKKAEDTFASQGPPFVAYGGALQAAGDSTLAAMQADPGNTGTITNGALANYGFSQIAVVPAGNFIPVPEPRTAAVALCGLFVAFLVGRQLYLNRKSQPSLAGATLA